MSRPIENENAFLSEDAIFTPSRVLVSDHCKHYNDKLHMQPFGAKSIISSYPDKGWKLSTVKKVCSRVDHTGSAILRKPSNGRPAMAFSFMGEFSKLDRVKTMGRLLVEKLTLFDEILR